MSHETFQHTPSQEKYGSGRLFKGHHVMVHIFLPNKNNDFGGKILKDQLTKVIRLYIGLIVLSAV